MKRLKEYIDEAFRINKDTKLNEYKYHPKTKDELKKLIKELLHERGNNADLNDIDVSKITDMVGLFMGLIIRNIDISKWDVSNVENMNGMFIYCYNFNCDLSNWDVSNVKDMTNMFFSCENFNSDLSKWNVSNVTNMDFMFVGCDSLKNIPDWYEE